MRRKSCDSPIKLVERYWEIEKALGGGGVKLYNDAMVQAVSGYVRISYPLMSFLLNFWHLR